MSERYEAYKAREARDKDYNERLLNEQSVLESEHDKVAKNLEDIKDKRRSVSEAYSKFLKDVKEVLLAEGIYDIFSACLPESEERNVVAENLVRNYIKENGVDTIFRNMAKTIVNESLQHQVNVYWKKITEKADKEDPETFRMSMSDKIAFLDDLNKEGDIANVKQAIALRVSNAEEEFINSNMEDKYDLDNIIDDTKSRIEATKQDRYMSDETKEKIEQEAANLSKQKMNQIRENRSRNVLEHMVRLLSNTVITNESLRESYSGESGKIDMSKVVTTAKCMYGFLETLNTCRIEKIDESYIEKVFNEMK